VEKHVINEFGIDDLHFLLMDQLKIHLRQMKKIRMIRSRSAILWLSGKH
jgi:hypothetical protein